MNMTIESALELYERVADVGLEYYDHAERDEIANEIIAMVNAPTAEEAAAIIPHWGMRVDVARKFARDIRREASAMLDRNPFLERYGTPARPHGCPVAMTVELLRIARLARSLRDSPQSFLSHVLRWADEIDPEPKPHEDPHETL